MDLRDALILSARRREKASQADKRGAFDLLVNFIDDNANMLRAGIEAGSDTFDVPPDARRESEWDPSELSAELSVRLGYTVRVLDGDRMQLSCAGHLRTAAETVMSVDRYVAASTDPALVRLWRDTRNVEQVLQYMHDRTMPSDDNPHFMRDQSQPSV